MSKKPEFILKYGISKKGNETVTVSQIKSENYPFPREQGFSCSQKFKEVIKIKTVADREYYSQYLEKTVKEVFEIAFQLQEWRLIPFSPSTQSKIIELKPIEIPDHVYFKGDWND